MTNLPVSWISAPATPVLPVRNVHIWQIQLEVSPTEAGDLERLLSADELERAARFHFQQHRAHFVAGRGQVRRILSRYLQQGPEQIRFRYNAFGKPELDDPEGLGAVHFNLSHSNGLALLAIAQDAPIGIDLELIQDKTRLEEVGPQVFASTELEVLDALEPTERRRRFFQYWTRKEAYIKALGRGFALPLRQIDVSHTPEHPVLYLDAASPSPGISWYLSDWVPQAGFLAAVATPGQDWQFSTYR